MGDRWATFDCYGTLVDWMTGIRGTLARVWPLADADALLRAYHRIEPSIQSGRAVPYRRVLAETMRGVADAERLEVPAGSEDALAESLPAWPVFPEVPDALAALREAGWWLGVLSNTDPDLLGASLAAIDVPVDVIVVASEIGSYKPAFGHWETFFRRTGADRARHVHVAASLFHDVEPCALLGLPCVWINRMGEASALPRAGESPDLRNVPALLEELLPARGAGGNE